jgi:hypothetical protein
MLPLALPVEGDIEPCSSIGSFERKLKREDPELVKALLNLDEKLADERENKGRLPNTRVRMRNLDAICASATGGTRKAIET